MATGDNLILGKLNTASDSTHLNVTGASTWGVKFESSDTITFCSTAQADTAVQGICNAHKEKDLHPAAVQGWSNKSAFGVVGVSREGCGIRANGLTTGLHGDSPLGFGVVGVSWSETGVYGHSEHWTGVVGSTNNPRNYAGYFWGSVGIEGNLTVWGKKSAAVPFPDGSHRLMYAVESPASWFEDFGTARLVRGRARVKLDRAFASVARLQSYHVFLTPEGDSRGLYVARKTRTGFEVREQQGGTHDLRFGYRVVALRKDVSAKRFERVALPKRTPIPEAAALPKRLPLPKESGAPARPARKGKETTRGRAARRPGG